MSSETANIPTSNSLTTADAVRLTGLSRKTLSNYIDRGICAPRRESDNANADLHWTFEQIFAVDRARMLRGAGLSVDETSAIASQGNNAVEQALYNESVAQVRTARRTLKESLMSRREREDIMRVGPQEGMYLRYIPQRWMALAPADRNELIMPGTSEHMALYTGLAGVARVAGWCAYRSTGILTSLHADGDGLSSYAYTYLATPPMPCIVDKMFVDGGCYRAFDPDGLTCCNRNDGHCNGCARFGRAPTSEELFRWNVAKQTREGLWARTQMIDQLDEPYLTGLWAGFTNGPLDGAAARMRKPGCRRSEEHGSRRHELGGGKERPATRGGALREPGDKRDIGRGPAQDPAQDPDDTRVSVRPRLMPHVVQLPLGVTGCVVPAGVYLCFQCDDGDQMRVYNQLLGTASVLERAEMTPARERELSALLSRAYPKPSRLQDPFLEPFAQPIIQQDPAMQCWYRKATPADIRNLVLPINMALQPEKGFLVIGDALPQAFPDDEPRYEFQMLVDAAAIDDPPPSRTF